VFGGLHLKLIFVSLIFVFLCQIITSIIYTVSICLQKRDPMNVF